MYAIFQISYGLPMGTGSGTELLFVLAAMAIFVSLRLYRGMKGTRFSRVGVYRLPSIYLVLTVLSLFALSPSYADVAIVAAAIAAGYMVGLRLASGLQFFEKEGTTYYKRSQTIMVIWLASYITRIGIEFAYPSNMLFGFAIEAILALTTGMILGEATHIMRSHRSYRK
jgi:hypothetical protein